MGMEIRADNWKEITKKNGGKLLIFNLQIRYPEEDGDYVIGMMLNDGSLYPPSVRVNGMMITTVYFSLNKALAIWQAVRTNDVYLDLYKRSHPMLMKELAVTSLQLPAHFLKRLFPGVAGQYMDKGGDD